MPTLDRQDNVFVLDVDVDEGDGDGDGEAVGIIDRAVTENAVRATAVAIARAQAAKAGDTLGTIKARMYAQVLITLRDTTNPLV